MYDITIKKGGMVYKAEKVPLAGVTTYEIPLTTLKVNFPGVKSVNQTTISVGSTSVVSKDWTNDKAEFTLFKGLTYNLKVQKGGMVHEATVTCNEGEVSYDVPLSKLTVKFPGVKSVNKTTVSVGSTSVTSNDWQSDETMFTLFKGLIYNLKIQKGGMIHEATVTCDKDEVSYDAPLTKLTVNFTGVKSVNQITVSANSTQVTTKDWVNDSTTFILFKDVTYNLKLQKGTMVHEGSIICDESKETYDVPTYNGTF